MLNQLHTKQILLIILDGWGFYSKYHGNAIKQSKTPTLDLLWNNYPKTLLHASENHVGLPSHQMGNSEVGHTTIGSGRTIDQALVRINKSIKHGDFFNNKIINNIYKLTNNNRSKIHLIGLCSDGGVHSHIDHLIALINISKKYINIKTCIHIITDGRDTNPQSAKNFIERLLKCIEDVQNIRICTISGRYYGMDRDCRWQRTQKTYSCLIHNYTNKKYSNKILRFIDDSYKNNIYDEFILPTRINEGKIDNSDGLIFFNFRPDRMRQLTQAFCNQTFKGFKTKQLQNLNIATFTIYDSQLKLPVIFNKIAKNNFLGQVISEQGLKQFRLAETEKYAHVTYFLNGGREEPFPGEDRELIPSPQAETYDLTPDMSALKITSKLIEVTQSNKYSLIVVNYANADMLGHTGSLLATKKAIETVDHCLKSVLKTINNDKITTIITADHGNADMMFDKNNKPYKSHTTNLVPFIIINDSQEFKKIRLKKIGSLTDIAPTILNLLKIKIPNDMDGQSLIDTHINKHNCKSVKNIKNFIL